MTPITIRDISSPDALADLCAMVYEHPAFAIEGKPRCWHEKEIIRGVIFDDFIVPSQCAKCRGVTMANNYVPLMTRCPDNPDLLTDLNAVHELEMVIFKRNDFIQVSCWHATLYELCQEPNAPATRNLMVAPAHIRLEALATVLDVECGECGGRGTLGLFDEPDMGKCSDYATCKGRDSYCAGCEDCPTCHGTKRVSLIQAWAEKWGGR